MEDIQIKSMKDESGKKFFPLTHSDAVIDNNGKKLTDTLNTKLSPENIKAGNAVAITTDQNDITIDVTLPEAINIINNLETNYSGQGALDAYQGKVLKESIPVIANDLETPDDKKVLSAYQGFLLGNRVVPEGGATGQVLKKSGDGNHELEWGDAADPNAIVGDGSIMKIVELTYAEYKTLEEAGELREDTEYHISDLGGDPDNIVSGSGISEAEVQAMIDTSIDTIESALIPTGGTSGQVLKKVDNTDHNVEWGDAADPNAIIGDGTIQKIVELPYNDYITLSDKGQLDEDTEYHINDWTETSANEIKANQITMNNGTDIETIVNDLDSRVITNTNDIDLINEEIETISTSIDTVNGAVNSINETLNTKDIVDDGQNTRLDIAEGNIDSIVNTVNSQASSLSTLTTRFNNLSNTVSGNIMTVYSTASSKDDPRSFTFGSGLYLVLAQVNGNHMGRVDMVYGAGTSIAGYTTIKEPSSNVFFEYSTNSIKISSNYTCMIRILRMP